VEAARQVVAKCVPGCERERRAIEVCCSAHWKRLPRELKVEMWAAQKEAETGRGRRSNGKATKRWSEAFRQCVSWLLQECVRDPKFASEP
jgi:hypothetical protein